MLMMNEKELSAVREDLILSTVPAGQHVLRVSKAGEKDDERVIEIREGADEQVIQAQLKTLHGASSQPSPSQASEAAAFIRALCRESSPAQNVRRVLPKA